ncbi:hypothetical protein HPC49_16685 [Pyxidicoccus fallax]|uniref:Uncharacterized protein n=1 Tax=Pyxidicoccus fallax TaxID=394095 RepID=A0A848LJD7_9BACT|nr:hypothetical protein [Pyxidicoccus fallax]NMO17814.1 hypothetical protein [Pyxidicoccus fallax]NPC79854.1 hypothetical protein [Pyxidicoccus fallax]
MQRVGLLFSVLTFLLLSSPGRAHAQTLELPIEVIGPEGYTRSVSFTLSSEAAAQSVHLWLQAHNLSYEGKGSVRFNDDATWIPLDNTTVTVEGRGRNYGGIGGAFATLSMRLPIPAGALKEGTNTLHFRFNYTDERSIGYRVLRFNLLRADGKQVIQESVFSHADPHSWTAPPIYQDPASIAEGEALWRTATLVPSSKNGTPMRAHCMDCHTQSGMDLKYFAYSNHAIVERARFHGLNEKQGLKIAAYIRTLPNVQPWGRPWNPPYQPGPGLDSRPVEQWAAGAGIDWVLPDDQHMLQYIFPQGITEEAVSTKANLSAREIPTTLQLPDWNHWLPSIHPKDAWGDDFVNSRVSGSYDGQGTWALANDPTGTRTGRARAARVVASGYSTYRSEFLYFQEEWNLSLYNFLLPRYPNTVGISDPVYSRKIYSTGLWKMVKEFELMNDFRLDGHYQKLIPTSRDSRAWLFNYSFDVSPNTMKLPAANTGINNNSTLMHLYFSTAWYHVALVLNNGNHSDGDRRNSQRPIDWPYTHGFILHLSHDVAGNPSTMSNQVLFLIKGMQTADNSQPLKNNGSWHIRGPARIASLVHFGFSAARKTWGIPPEQRKAIFEVLLRTWLKKTKEYSPETWRTDYAIDPSQPYTFVDQFPAINNIWYMIPRFRYFGVDAALVEELTQWAESVFTGVDWTPVRNATCTERPTGEISCTSG